MRCATCNGNINPETGRCIQCGRELKVTTQIKENEGEKSPTEKRCANPKCHKTFPGTTDYFNVNRANPDGLERYCKTCHRQRQKDARADKKKREKSLNKKKTATKTLRDGNGHKLIHGNARLLLPKIIPMEESKKEIATLLNQLYGAVRKDVIGDVCRLIENSLLPPRS
jgi:hypothetical protein